MDASPRFIYIFYDKFIWFSFSPSIGAAVGQHDNSNSRFAKPFDRSCSESTNLVSTSNNNHEYSLAQRTQQLVSHNTDLEMQQSYHLFPNVMNSKHLVKGVVRPSHMPPVGHRNVQHILPFPRPRPGTNKNLRAMEENHSVASKLSLKHSLLEEDLEIPWSELVLKENIGAG